MDPTLAAISYLPLSWQRDLSVPWNAKLPQPLVLTADDTKAVTYTQEKKVSHEEKAVSVSHTFSGLPNNILANIDAVFPLIVGASSSARLSYCTYQNSDESWVRYVQSRTVQFGDGWGIVSGGWNVQNINTDTFADLKVAMPINGISFAKSLLDMQPSPSGKGVRLFLSDFPNLPRGDRGSIENMFQAVVAATVLVRRGGHAVFAVTMPILSTLCSALIWLLACTFSKVYLFRPISSNGYYLVCMDRRTADLTPPSAGKPVSVTVLLQSWAGQFSKTDFSLDQMIVTGMSDNYYQWLRDNIVSVPETRVHSAKAFLLWNLDKPAPIGQ